MHCRQGDAIDVYSYNLQKSIDCTPTRRHLPGKYKLYIRMNAVTGKFTCVATIACLNTFLFLLPKLYIIHLKSLRHLPSSLPRDVAQSVACAIIGSRLISTCRTRSSSAVTLARPSVSSSLQISSRSFTYASPYLWNQLHPSFHQPHSVHSPPGSPHPVDITSSQSHLRLSRAVSEIARLIGRKSRNFQFSCI